jgi:TRAP-type C4-dicarboxylate transport system permease small subunit
MRTGAGGKMETLFRTVERLTRVLGGGAGVALVFMMCLTAADVILRAFNRPIMGTYEIVSFLGAIVMGLVNPLVSWTKNHIFADFLIVKFPVKMRKGFQVGTRCIALGLFILIGWNLILFGSHLKEASEVSATLAIPFYPIAYGIAVSAFIQCLVFMTDILRIVRGEE